MSRIGALRAFVGVVVGLFCLVTGEAGAGIIDVPGTELTIAAGITAAAPGDTVRVAPGTYAVNVDCGGKQVCLMSSAGADVTTLTPASPTVATLTCDGEEPDGTQLLGFTLTGSTDLGPPMINIGLNSALTIQYCVFRDNPVDNVVIATIGLDVLIRYNVFVRNGGTSCIGVTGGRTNIFNNTFVNNSRGFFTIGGLTRASSNIVLGCTDYGVYGVFSELSYNDMWNNGVNYSGGATSGPGDMMIDPLFANPALDDYSLQIGSPCIDAGNPDPVFNDPDGTLCDIGGVPLEGYFVPPPEVGSVTIGVSGDNQHVISSVPQIAWEYLHNWNLPQSGAEVEVGTDNDWTTAELWNPGEFIGAITAQAYNGAPLADGSTYYARVRVRNDTLWSAWVETSFRLNTRPTTCELLFPPNESIILSCCPTLVTMNATDAEGDVLQYEFFVSLDEEHQNIVAYETGIPGGFGQTDWTVEGLTSENQLHWWRARAFDGFEAGPWSQPRSFWLDGYNDVPGAFALLSPVDGQTDVPQTPPFSWEPAADADPGADLTYWVEVSSSPGFEVFTSVSAGFNTALTWPYFLSTATQYWWRVVSDDGRGGVSETSVWSFTTTPICSACLYQVDFDEDGYNTVLDIGYLIDILFAGSDDTQDPGCNVTRADFDCDGYATSLDLSKMVDYLFAGAAGPCDPCAL